MSTPDPSTDRRYLTLAARHALRGAGRVEPNPLVGAVIVRGGGRDGEKGGVLGIGHHREFGGPHAEVEAIESARRQGHADLRGASMYITLEPCNHHGKTPPCTEAILRAGIARVVIAAADPHPRAGGGAEVLRRAGVEVRLSEASELANLISRPFIKRTTTGLPWVIAKWAQTIDGRIATRSGESKWISSSHSRRRVHRLRARVDAIITGLGTVQKDDPLLTAREIGRPRRTAQRIVVDPALDIALDSALVRTANEAPLIIACAEQVLTGAHPKRETLQRAGAQLVGLPPGPGGLDLASLLRHHAAQRNVATVLVESGPVLMGSLIDSGLVDQAIVYIAPLLLGDERGVPPASGRVIERLASASRLELVRARRSGADVELTYLAK
jgi:diaminohydroxyphosphoribosylaminopyrimidine deaminase / 5-amino-6-(5-phosphoribosylamino)uracil reductase